MLVEVWVGRGHNEIQILGESGQGYGPEVNWREKEINEYFLRARLYVEKCYVHANLFAKKKKKAVIILFFNQVQRGQVSYPKPQRLWCGIY